MAGWSTTAKSAIFVTSFATTGNFIDLSVIDVMHEKPVNGFVVGATSPSLMFILLRVSSKMMLTVLPVSTRILATSTSLIQD